MDCAEEVSLLKRELSRIPGIYELDFDVMRARLDLEFDDARVSSEAIAAAVARTGMRAERWTGTEVTPRRSWREPRFLATAASALMLAVATVLEIATSGSSLFETLAGHGTEHAPLPIVLGLYLAVMITGFAPYAAKTIAAARAWRPDMNVLVALSMTGAAILGEWSEAATLAFLFGLANLLETWSLAFARRSVGALLQVSPTEAAVLHAHGEHRLPVDRISVGSIVRVRPGDRIPCDGEVVTGASDVDQALITGESVPIFKEPGSQVWAGTMNGDGTLDIRTTRAASDTTLARIVRMVEGSEQRRARSEQFVARFSRFYTPAMIAIAAGVAVLPPLILGHWGSWFYQGMVVLLFACPCALVISTPVTIASALASAARNGVLVKGGAFLEETARLRAIAFDKTGVLTEGRPGIERILPLGGHDETGVLECLSALEEPSEHPVGRALADYARARGIRAEGAQGFDALEGRGAEARIGGREFWAGSSRLLADKQLLSHPVSEMMSDFEDSEHTAVACGSDDQVWAVISVSDPIRPEAVKVVEGLRNSGIEHLTLLTGDNTSTGRAVAERLGITDTHAELMPEEKAAVVEQLRVTYGSVAMVGDGRNDAPALAAASVGIALGGRATDIALETADVVLMSADLEKLLFLIRHARRTSSVIRQNVAIALGWKVVFLIAAATGAGSLWIALMADMGATLLVVFNGLRMLGGTVKKTRIPAGTAS